MRRLSDRLNALEAADLERARWERLAPLERAYELIGRGTSVEQWQDAELEAFCTSECAHLKELTDAQLAALVEADDPEALYHEWTGLHWPAVYRGRSGRRWPG